MIDWRAMLDNVELLRNISFILVIVGGIALGLFGLTGVNFLTVLLGAFLSRLLCIVIGVGAGYLIYLKVSKKI